MEGEVSTNTQMGFSGGGVGEGGDSSASVDTTPSTVSTGAETSTTESSATGNESGLPPTATQPVADNTVAQSEKGSFVLRYNERTGRNEVVSTMPQETEQEDNDSDQPYDQSQPQQQPQQTNNTYAGDELINALTNPQPPAQAPQPAGEYTLQELQEAIQSGQVEEARIPLQLRSGYYAAMEQARQQMMQAQQPPELV